MPSPFPGMDPFLEGQQLWRDFHTRFIAELSDQLVPQLRPRYTVLMEEDVYVEYAPPDRSQPLRPDMTVADNPIRAQTQTRPAVLAGGARPVEVMLPSVHEEKRRFLAIRHRTSGDVVTVIELLSPTNKRSGTGGRAEYLEKRNGILLSPVHLVEIDLLRGGERLPMAETLPEGDYYVISSRASRRPKADVWAFSMREPLPTIAVPLAGSDPDAAIDLGAAFQAVYDHKGYDYILDYTVPCKPALDAGQAAWVETLLARVQG